MTHTSGKIQRTPTRSSPHASPRPLTPSPIQGWVETLLRGSGVTNNSRLPGPCCARAQVNVLAVDVAAQGHWRVDRLHVTLLRRDLSVRNQPNQGSTGRGVSQEIGRAISLGWWRRLVAVGETGGAMGGTMGGMMGGINSVARVVAAGYNGVPGRIRPELSQQRRRRRRRRNTCLPTIQRGTVLLMAAAAVVIVVVGMVEMLRMAGC